MRKQQDGSDGRVLFRSDDDTLARMRKVANEQVEERAVGSIDGARKIFYSSSEFIPDNFRVYLNGILQIEGDDYNLLSSSSFTFVTAPPISSIVTLKYQLA